MNKIIYKAPLNSLSFGNVSFNLLKEMYKRKMEVSMFPIGNVDVSSYGEQDENFKKWLQDCISNRFKNLDKETTTLQLWHLNGSEQRISSKQILYSFYELDNPTHAERSLSKLQDKTVFSSTYASNQFEGSHFSPLGFDNSFHKTGKEYMPDKIHFGLMGKFEKENTQKK